MSKKIITNKQNTILTLVILIVGLIVFIGLFIGDKYFIKPDFSESAPVQNIKEKEKVLQDIKVSIEGKTFYFYFPTARSQTQDKLPLIDFQTEGYKLLAEVEDNKKIYSKIQDENKLKTLSLEDVYVLVSEDDVAQKIYPRFPYEIKESDWIIKPDYLIDIRKARTNRDYIKDEKYLNFAIVNTYVPNGCSRTSMFYIFGNVPLKESGLKTVLVLEDNVLLVPTQSKLYEALYKDQDFMNIQTYEEIKSMEFERFVNSYPVLVWKNALGIYQLVFPEHYGGIANFVGC